MTYNGHSIHPHTKYLLSILSHKFVSLFLLCIKIYGAFFTCLDFAVKIKLFKFAARKRLLNFTVSNYAKLVLTEASYFDQINRTKNWLEYDRKIITPTNMNDGTWPKDYLSLSYIFSYAPIVNACRCDLFGHVQIFWSYSFGHAESVKWLFLL